MGEQEEAFMPLDASIKKKKKSRGAGKVISESWLSRQKSRKSSIIYIGRLPHGFYEEELRGFFSQFGNIRRLRVSRNKKTGKSKHYAFLQFDSPEVAEIVVDTMHNYLLFEHMLQVKLVPAEKIHPRMWVGSFRTYKAPNWQQMERKLHNRERGPEEQHKLVNSLLKRDRKRRKKIEAAGIEYDFPDLSSSLPAVPKKIKFTEDED